MAALYVFGGVLAGYAMAMTKTDNPQWGWVLAFAFCVVVGAACAEFYKES
ncbi:hypothetical protein [Methylobacterium indicum]|uniref:Uncharacterized protein n=1 Tax=Methylobacterium indicum TaxID=1775910 RepID=A0A8H9CAW3_9HYPH|nr:hypothetical protein [Methylobacterium indicum]BCM87860.1 hypothetical protein mvi_63210 [Methylobacterium indicum]